MTLENAVGFSFCVKIFFSVASLKLNYAEEREREREKEGADSQ